MKSKLYDTNFLIHFPNIHVYLKLTEFLEEWAQGNLTNTKITFKEYSTQVALGVLDPLAFFDGRYPNYKNNMWNAKEILKVSDKRSKRIILAAIQKDDQNFSKPPFCASRKDLI